VLTVTRAAITLLLVLTTAATAVGCSRPNQVTTASSSSLATATTDMNATPVPAPAPAPATATGGDWEIVGTSVQNRPIRLRAFGHGPRTVLFVGGIHGDEAEGAYTTAQLPAAFEAAGLADSVTLWILEDANPDGRAAGTRGNANGVDVNRNFPASNFDTTNPTNGGRPLSQPESKALFDTIERVNPNLVLVAHSWAGRKFINFDGPAREIATRFGAASGLEVEASSSFAPTPGSLGSYVGRDRGTPILTIEVLKGTAPTAVWGQLRPALLEAIRG
jgi:hypothetical protein